MPFVIFGMVSSRGPWDTELNHLLRLRQRCMPVVLYGSVRIFSGRKPSGKHALETSTVSRLLSAARAASQVLEWLLTGSGTRYMVRR